MQTDHEHPLLVVEIAFPGSAVAEIERADYGAPYDDLAAALLATVEARVEQWHDPAPRLPWADWLDERGRCDSRHFDVFQAAAAYVAGLGDATWQRLMDRSDL